MPLALQSERLEIELREERAAVGELHEAEAPIGAPVERAHAVGQLVDEQIGQPLSEELTGVVRPQLDLDRGRRALREHLPERVAHPSRELAFAFQRCVVVVAVADLEGQRAVPEADHAAWAPIFVVPLAELEAGFVRHALRYAPAESQLPQPGGRSRRTIARTMDRVAFSSSSGSDEARVR